MTNETSDPGNRPQKRLRRRRRSSHRRVNRSYSLGRWLRDYGSPRPQNAGHELRRFHRRGRDRQIGLLEIPVRRYTCRDCHWVGLSIDENRV